MNFGLMPTIHGLSEPSPFKSQRGSTAALKGGPDYSRVTALHGARAKQMSMEEEILLRGKTIAWAGAVVVPLSGDTEVFLRFTDGTGATIGASAREGYPLDMYSGAGKGQEL